MFLQCGNFGKRHAGPHTQLPPEITTGDDELSSPGITCVDDDCCLRVGSLGSVFSIKRQFGDDETLDGPLGEPYA